jgi:hypothetical protein
VFAVGEHTAGERDAAFVLHCVADDGEGFLTSFAVRTM